MANYGKRSNPDYSKITLYILTSTRLKVAHKLLGTGWDMSEVVEELVSAWADGDIDLPSQALSPS